MFPKVDSYERGRTLEALLEYVQEKITEHNSLPSATSTEEPESEELLPPPDPVEDSMVSPSSHQHIKPAICCKADETVSDRFWRLF